MVQLNIKGFKCFSNDIFNIRNITVLAGANGAGKSSFIQSILLSRIVIEKQCEPNVDGWYENTNKSEVTVPLNSMYNLELGTDRDVIKDDESNKENIIQIQIDEEFFDFSLNDTENDVLSLKAKSKLSDNNNFIKKKEFYYLNAERLGPRHISENCYMPFLSSGFSGEYSAHIIDTLSKIPSYASAVLSSDKKFKIEFDKWIDILFPGITIISKPLSNLKTQILVRNSANKSEQLANNIGFGISYALPILVNGLIAKKDSLFIIENPEAHLHPKAQSSLGEFLGYVASQGVNIVIETHSEHIINGLRKAIFLNKNLSSESINIYFFKGFEGGHLKYEEILTDEKGNLSSFPIDFFDQVRQDLSEIRQLSI